MDDEYVPPWRRGTMTMSNDGMQWGLNGHMRQVKPRTEKRPAVLEERIARAREKAAGHKPSGHSLIR